MSPPVDSASLVHLLDSLIVPGLEKYHIPGMVVAIVHDSDIVLAKGYGYADVERKIPFDPDTHSNSRTIENWNIPSGTVLGSSRPGHKQCLCMTEGIQEPAADFASALKAESVSSWRATSWMVR